MSNKNSKHFNTKCHIETLFIYLDLDLEAFLIFNREFETAKTLFQEMMNNEHTGCSIWIATKVNKYCDHVFRVRHFSLQIYVGKICTF